MISQLADAPTTSFTVECRSQIDDLIAVRQAWQRLAATAVEPNVFLEPLFLLPALTHLDGNEAISCVLVWSSPQLPSAADGANLAGPVLCGLFPIIKGRGIGEKHGMWAHDYAFSGAPLVRADCVRNVLQAFFDWLESQSTTSFRWPEFPVDNALYQQLLQLVQQRNLPIYVQKNYLRAEFRPAANSELYLRRAMSKSTRKELLRMERRLRDAGNVTIEALSAGADVAPWIGRFLELEASGWKGDQSSALKSSASSSDFFTAMMQAAHQAERLIMLELRIDGRAIAMNVALRTSEGGFYFKIAHTPDFRRFMPGRILELGFIRWLHDHPEIRWFDSCAMPNHQMIERLWDGRRHMQSFWTGSNSRSGRIKIALLAILNEIKRLR